jgi:hypothetical protein
LPIVSGSRGLERYLAGGGSALCATSRRDWARLDPALRRDAGAVLDTVGDKVVARMSTRGGSKDRVAPE